jgi:molybdopterin/thiamine biosynthesis adenylyltransferase
MENRYARHSLITDWSQKSLSDSKVIIVGMGALGNEVARILAMAGVGHLLLCDPDRVEISNLSRTVLFRQSDIGRFKVEAASDHLTKLAPDMNITIRPLPLIQGIGLAELRDASLVISCLDSRSSRLQLVGRCQLVRAVVIDGGTTPWGGEVRPYLNPDGSCYGCSLTPESRGITDVPWSCLDTSPQLPEGSAIPSSALVGTWMGSIAVRYLMGLSSPNVALVIDIPRMKTTQLKQERDLDCPLHQSLGNVTQINISHQDSLDALRQVLGFDVTPLTWEAVQRKISCTHCGFEESRWGFPILSGCPQCGERIRPHTTLELDIAPGDLSLAALGIPPCEILTIRTAEGLKWVELKT